jgi:perosamine synthetase
MELKLSEKNFILFHKPYVTDAEIEAVTEVIRSGWWTMGQKTIDFENDFSSFLGVKRSVAVNSWTAAGHIALEAIGIQEGDEVIVPAVTFPATAEVVCYFKAKPVFVDVQKDTFNIDPGKIEEAITPRTKAIIPVHYGGQPCDMDEILDIAKRHNLFVIEDAAHAFPAYYKNKAIGTISDITCFSFYATKTIATGEGGMLCTNNDSFADRASIMRLHGIDRDAWKRYSSEGSWYYEIIAPGFKYNITDIAASLGITQLKKANELLQMRNSIKEKYDKGFEGCNLLSTTVKKSDRVSSNHLYPILINTDILKINKTEFIELLKENGVGVGVHFIPVYRHPYYKNTFNLSNDNFPISEYIHQREISLPIWPGMTNEQIDKVISTVLYILKKNMK